MGVLIPPSVGIGAGTGAGTGAIGTVDITPISEGSSTSFLI